MTPLAIAVFLSTFVHGNDFVAFWLGAIGAMVSGALWMSIVPLEKR